MRSKCEKVINIIRCLAGCSWGTERNLILIIYKAMIRAIFDYGCLAHGSVAKSTLAKLDVVQAKAVHCGIPDDTDSGAAGGNGGGSTETAMCKTSTKLLGKVKRL